RLPTIWTRIMCGTHFIRPKALQIFALPEERTHMWPEELIWRADQEIAVEFFDVDQAMRAVVNGVDICQSAMRVGQTSDFFDWVNGSNGVGCIANSNEPRAITQFRF